MTKMPVVFKGISHDFYGTSHFMINTDGGEPESKTTEHIFGYMPLKKCKTPKLKRCSVA